MPARRRRPVHPSTTVWPRQPQWYHFGYSVMLKIPFTVARGDGIDGLWRWGKPTWDLISALSQRISDAGIDIVMTETLRNFDGQPGFTLVQGQ